MHDLVKEVIEKHKDNMKSAEDYLRNYKGDSQISYTPHHIKKLMEENIIPKELGLWWLKRTDEMSRDFHEKQEFIKNNPNLSQEERMGLFYKSGELSPEETAKSYEDAALSSELYICLLQNRQFLDLDFSIPEKINKKLFANIDIKKDIGIVRAIADSIYHLGKILREMTHEKLYENMYVAKGNAINSKGETITLEYTFRASTSEDADIAMQEYKNIMLKKGLKTWMAYWCSANEFGMVEYKCQLVDVMKWSADDERESYFSQKEKEEFWALTKMLGMTKLSRSKIVRKQGKGREYRQWIEQPLVEIFGGERLLETEDKYPASIAVRVLMPNMGRKSFVPATYNISTAKLNPSEIYLPFIIQTRASQMQRGEKEIFFEWDYLFELGNLQQTAISNSRMAKAKIRQKMEKLKTGNIIEGYEEELIGINVQPRKTKKSTAKITAKKSD